MGEKIKSYLAFTSIPYRIVIFAGLPLGLLALLLSNKVDIFMGMMMVLVIFTGVEVISDSWVFGGVAVRNSGYLEYLKCSGNRKSVMKMALAVNMLRHLLTMVLLMVFALVKRSGMGNGEYLNGKQLILCINLVLVTYFFLNVQLLITRMLEGATLVLAVISLGILLQMGSYYLVAALYLLMLPVLVILSVLVSVLGIKIVIKRMEASFYDRTA